MERYWQVFGYEKRGPDDWMIFDIFEAADPRTLVRIAEDIFGLRQPADPTDRETRFELRYYQHGEDAKVLGKWDITRNQVPKGCRKPRACIMVDGKPIDAVQFCLGQQVQVT